MPAQKSKMNMVWIDLETSGLNVNDRVILEIATIVTDKDLNVIAEGPDLVIHQPDKALAAMDGWCMKQHRASELIDEVRHSTISLAQAEEETLAFVSLYCPPRSCPLCGNAICFDRRFLIQYMPKLDELLSYRNVDVSTVKELVTRWRPEEMKMIGNSKTSKHRARSDILESIAELRHYQNAVFQRGPAQSQKGA
ncbi:oligoribonuclease [Candidatus Bipolaricaulota bacterium]|nr:oligoribonuclease [Candidatus Bipolaricaulota bacterium]